MPHRRRRATAALLLSVVLLSSVPWEVAAVASGDAAPNDAALVLGSRTSDVIPEGTPFGEACMCLCTLCPSSTVGRPSATTVLTFQSFAPSAAVIRAASDPHASPASPRLLRPPRAV